MHSVRSYVLVVCFRGKHVVDAGAMLHPLEINHVSRKVVARVATDVVIAIGLEVRPRTPALTCLLRALRLNRE